MARTRPRLGSSSDYIYDNVARKPETNDRTNRQRTPEKRSVRQLDRKVTIRRNQAKALQIDGIYLVGLIIALVCILNLCVSYLQVQSSIMNRMDNIKGLEHELKTIKSKNDMLETQINTTLDLDHVYKVATQELGMVYANQEQVLLYDKTESEYVRQYEDIPKQ